MFLNSNARESKVDLPGPGSPTITNSLNEYKINREFVIFDQKL